MNIKREAGAIRNAISMPKTPILVLKTALFWHFLTPKSIFEQENAMFFPKNRKTHLSNFMKKTLFFPHRFCVFLQKPSFYPSNSAFSPRFLAFPAHHPQLFTPQILGGMAYLSYNNPPLQFFPYI